MDARCTERFMTISVRTATTTDAAPLAQFAARTFAETFGQGSSEADMALHLASTYSADCQRAEIADPEVAVLLVEADGLLIGYAQVRVETPPPCVQSATPVELWRFYVDRPWQGRGVAQLLMRAVIESARERAADAIWLSVWEHNARAQSFYARCGYRQVGMTAFVVGTDVQSDWVMQRAVTPDDAALGAEGR